MLGFIIGFSLFIFVYGTYVIIRKAIDKDKKKKNDKEKEVS